MELLGALSNPETGALLLRVAQELDRLGAAIAKRDVEFPEHQLFQGAILKAMSDVLLSTPEGLRTIEVWAAVQRRLDRSVSKSTVKGMLAGNPMFIRLSRGLYRLRDQV